MRFTVHPEESGQRLDIFLAAKLENVTRSAVQRWIARDRVLVAGEHRKARYLVQPGEDVLVEPLPPEPSEVVPEAIPLQILYQDSHLLVIDKPSGMVVHPGAGNPRGTLANALVHYFQQISRRETIRPGIVHRLDKQTSGLLIVAKQEWVHDFLSRQFSSRKIEKQYLALVYKRMDRQKGEIGVPLGRHPTARTKISTRSQRPKEALTEYRVLRSYEKFSYLQVTPHTGRTHQIRVHLAHLGHAVVGDETYGPRQQQLKSPVLASAIRDLGRYFLHASHLTFTHPESKQRVSFESPLPPQLAELLNTLE